MYIQRDGCALRLTKMWKLLKDVERALKAIINSLGRKIHMVCSVLQAEWHQS